HPRLLIICSPISISNYGTGALPRIVGNNTPAVYVLNARYWTVQNLDLSQKGQTPQALGSGNQHGMVRTLISMLILICGPSWRFARTPPSHPCPPAPPPAPYTTLPCSAHPRRPPTLTSVKFQA